MRAKEKAGKKGPSEEEVEARKKEARKSYITFHYTLFITSITHTSLLHICWRASPTCITLTLPTPYITHTWILCACKRKVARKNAQVHAEGARRSEAEQEGARKAYKQPRSDAEGLAVADCRVGAGPKGYHRTPCETCEREPCDREGPENSLRMKLVTLHYYLLTHNDVPLHDLST